METLIQGLGREPMDNPPLSLASRLRRLKAAPNWPGERLGICCWESLTLQAFSLGTGGLLGASLARLPPKLVEKLDLMVILVDNLGNSLVRSSRTREQHGGIYSDRRSPSSSVEKTFLYCRVFRPKVVLISAKIRSDMSCVTKQKG